MTSRFEQKCIEANIRNEFLLKCISTIDENFDWGRRGRRYVTIQKTSLGTVEFSGSWVVRQFIYRLTSDAGLRGKVPAPVTIVRMWHDHTNPVDLNQVGGVK